MEVRFYDVGSGRLARVLQKMLEKTLSRGERAVVRFQHQSRAAELDAYLWNEPLDGFLPHALADERLYASAGSSGLQAEQPIILTTGVEVINAARSLFHWQEGGDGELASKFPIRAEGVFDLCCFLFSSGDGSEAVAQALWERAITFSSDALSASDTADISVNFWVDSGGAWIKRDGKHGGAKDEKVEEKVEEKVKNSPASVSTASVLPDSSASTSPASTSNASNNASNNTSNNAASPAATASPLARKQESLL